MKYLFSAALIIAATQVLHAQDIETEKAEIRRIIQTAYVEGLQNEGDAEKIEEGFHKDFRLLGLDETGQLWILPIEEWKDHVLKKRKKGELPRESSNLYKVEFEMIDITEIAAIAKLKCYSGKELKFIDYISLYKVGNEWKIVNKIFYKVD